MGRAFFFDVIAFALSILTFFPRMRYRRRLTAATLMMFCAWALIGSTWGMGFHHPGIGFSSAPLHAISTEPPFPAMLPHATHCLWDQDLFMAGKAWCICS